MLTHHRSPLTEEERRRTRGLRTVRWSAPFLCSIALAACGPGGAPTLDPSGPSRNPPEAESSSSDEESSSEGGGASSSGVAGDCGAQAIPPNLTGGCAPRFATPTATCEEIDLTGGKTYEIAWTTDGSGCETPWTLCAMGNPATEINGDCVTLSTDVNKGISRTGGLYYMKASDLDGMTSDNGVYHVLVASYYKSHKGSVAFRVKK